MMRQHSDNGSREERFISIRKLAALDMVFHRPTLILAEFAFAVGLGGILGTLSLFSFFHTPSHPLFILVVGCFFVLVGLNYVPMLLYAIHFMRYKDAENVVAFELAHKESYARKYMLQSLLLAVPFVVVLLAIVQQWQKDSFS